MSESFKDRFLREAGDRPYAWAVAHGLPKDLVTAVMRGGADYRPIQRTLKKLAEATGKSAHWWITGQPDPDPAPGESLADIYEAARGTSLSAPALVQAVASGHRADPDTLALCIRVVEEWISANDLEIDANRKGAIVSVLYDYAEKGAGDHDLERMLSVMH